MEEEVSHLRDGLIVLYKRDNSSRFQFRFRDKETGKWRRFSTKTQDIEIAKEKAQHIYDKYMFAEEMGIDNVLPTRNITYDKICNILIDNMNKDITRINEKGKKEGDNSTSTLKSYIDCFNNRIIPHFGKMKIDKITTKTILSFYKDVETNNNKYLSKNTIRIYNACLNKMFTKSIELYPKLMKGNIPKIPKNKGIKANPRGFFTKQEYMIMKNYMKKWIDKEPNMKMKRNKTLLLEMIIFLAHTGCRAGTEVMNIKFSDFYYTYNKKERFLSCVIRNGKTGSREIVCRDEIDKETIPKIQELYTDLTKMNRRELLKQDVYLFQSFTNKQNKTSSRYFQDLFYKFLEEYGLLYDRQGRKRSLYSLRHSYISWILMDSTSNISIHDIALQCGTSIQMIQKFYDSMIPSDIAYQLSGRAKKDLK